MSKLSRGKRLVALAAEKRRMYKNESNDNEKSTLDDSDADPDFDVTPLLKRHFPFFSKTDLKKDYITGSSSTPLEEIIEKDTQDNRNRNTQQPLDNNIIIQGEEKRFVNDLITDLLTKIVCDAISLSEQHKKKLRRARSEKEKIDRNLERKILLPPCKQSCLKKCKQFLNENTWLNILRSFWELNFCGRQLFLDSYVKQIKVKSRSSADSLNHKRNHTLKFELPLTGQPSKNISVCKTMFLHTLGTKTNGILTSHFKVLALIVNSIDGLVDTADNRGVAARKATKVRKDTLDIEIIRHIENYKPQVSHYKLVHAPRLVVFNETFAALHKDNNLCVLWHEGISGQNAPDVASSFYYVIRNSKEAVTLFIFWADNCSAQNKNWLLYMTFTSIVNAEWGPVSITLKYFEPGHSFMKADSVHGPIGYEWKNRAEVLDMNDLVDVVKKAGKQNEPVVLHFTDFIRFKDGSKQRRNIKSPGEYNLPLLDSIRIVQFRKGSRSLFFKISFSDTNFIESDFLKVKFSVVNPEIIEKDRGINTEKKNKIIKELLPHMTNRKKLFWQEMPTSEDAEDLCNVSASAD